MLGEHPFEKGESEGTAAQALESIGRVLESFTPEQIRRMPPEELDSLLKPLWTEASAAPTMLVPVTGAGRDSRSLLGKSGTQAEASPRKSSEIPAPRRPGLFRRTGDFFESFLDRIGGYDGTAAKVKLGYWLGLISITTSIVVELIAKSFGWVSNPNYKLPDYIQTIPGLLLFMSFAVIAAPLIEEMLFRSFGYGFIRDFLARKMGMRLAIGAAALASSVLFVIPHETSDPVLMGLRLMNALILAYAFQKGGLKASMAAHATFNFAILFPMLLAAIAAALSLPEMLGIGIAVAILLAGLALMGIGKINALFRRQERYCWVSRVVKHTSPRSRIGDFPGHSSTRSAKFWDVLASRAGTGQEGLSAQGAEPDRIGCRFGIRCYVGPLRLPFRRI